MAALTGGGGNKLLAGTKAPATVSMAALAQKSGERQIGSDTVKVNRRRYTDIDRVKVFAIVLVVIGHVPDTASPDWARDLRYYIYNFHMPLFMYLSGYVYFQAVNKPDQRSYRSYVAERANRLLIPFLAFAVFVINVKYVSSGVAEINRSNFSYLEGYKRLIFNTSNSPSLDLWYLVVLFVFSVASQPLMRQGTRYLPLLCAVSIVLYGIFAYFEPRGGMIDDFYIDRVCWFYVFFVMGAVSCAWRGFVLVAMRRAWLPFLVIFVVLQYLAMTQHCTFGSGWRFLLIGSASIVAFHGLFAAEEMTGDRIVLGMSRNVLIIYLLNSMMVGVVQQPFRKVAFLAHLPYMIQLAVITLVAIIVPIAVRSLVLRRRWLEPAAKYIT